MVKIIAILIGAIALVSCAARQVPSPTTTTTATETMETKVKPEGVMRLVSKRGLSHGCPVSGIIFTAHHVINPFLNDSPSIQAQEYGEYIEWSDSFGNSGVVTLDIYSPSRDLALLKVMTGDTPVYFRVAENVVVGEAVYWFEYNWESPDNATFEKLRKSHITEIFAGHAVIYNPPRRGASGSCLFNDSGKVVAVIIWGLPTDSMEYVGFSAILPMLLKRYK